MKTGMRARFAILAATTVILSSVGFARASTDPALDFSPTPDAPCVNHSDQHETIQGRVPLSDYQNGNAARGYSCNAMEVSHVGSEADGTGASGGFRVFRYDDGTHVCAYYDHTLLFPSDAQIAASGAPGVWVLDMTDPEHPVHTASLVSPAMQSPHESLSINQQRGLLGAVFGNPAFYHGQFDLYTLGNDCRYPQLSASLPMGVLGHEGSFSPDGNTYYAASLYGHTLTAIDTSNVLAPTIKWTSDQWNVHGLNVSDDGRYMYFADLARQDAGAVLGGTDTKGLTILDLRTVSADVVNPTITVTSHLTWPHIGTPQTAIPVTINGHKYLVEVDEFGSGDNVGAARMINIDDPAAPAVVSNMRLAVDNADQQNSTAPDAQANDPGAKTQFSGYEGHYCGVPREVDPGIVACSFILSGLRVFDIHDPAHPTEIAYFNRPSYGPHVGLGGYGPQGAYAMSQPAFDEARHQVWYSDGNTGFYAVQLDDTDW